MFFFCFLMIRLPPRSTRTDTLFPYTTLFRSAVAMGWLRRFVHPGSQALNWTEWRPPALVIIASRPDRTSATALRAHHPRWHQQSSSKAVRDGLTRSEERRGGKECVSTCDSGRRPDH